MVGHLPVDLQQLTQLRMVELATMTGTYIHTLHHIYFYIHDDAVIKNTYMIAIVT